MTGWQAFFTALMSAVAVGVLYNIFLEVRSIRRMMNQDRDIPPD